MKVKLYRKIIIIQIGILATLTTHYFMTQSRGYKAIGGEFLLIPLFYIVYISVAKRWKETNEYFERKESAIRHKDVYKEETRWN